MRSHDMSTRFPFHENDGFIALISVLVLSAIIVMMIAAFGIASLFARYDQEDAELKTQSNYLAESCLRMAALKIARDSAYAPPAGGACVPVGNVCPGESVCRICSVSAAFPKQVIVQAAYHGAYTTYSATISADLIIAHRREIIVSDACVIH